MAILYEQVHSKCEYSANISEDAPPYTLKEYSYRQAADDIAELARQLGIDSIILGGHDWLDALQTVDDKQGLTKM
jgi:hypothetical protein